MKIGARVCIVVLIAALLSSLAAYAADVGTDTYTLEDLYMKIDIPDDLLVFTQDITANDQNMDLNQDAVEQIKEYCKENNIYLDAMSLDSSSGTTQIPYEYTIVMISSEDSRNYFDFGLYDESEFPKDETCDGFLAGFQKPNATILDYSVSSGKQTKFIKFSYSYTDENGSTAYGRMCATVYNGMGICVNLLSYNGPVSSAQIQEQDDIANSIYFTQTLDVPSGTYAAQTIEKEKFESVGLPILLGAAGVCALVVLIVLSKKKKKKQEMAAAAAASQPDPVDPEARVTDGLAQKAPPESTEGGQRKARYCSKCGAILADGATFCQSCGESVRASSSEEIKQEAP